MKSMVKIHFIIKALEAEKNKYLFQLSVNHAEIKKRKMLLNKMCDYLSEYSKPENFKASHAIPLLLINLKNFSAQIEVVIKNTEIEIMNFEKKSDFLMGKVEKVDQKIQLLNKYKEKMLLNQMNRDDKVEQNMLDDIVSVKYF